MNSFIWNFFPNQDRIFAAFPTFPPISMSLLLGTPASDWGILLLTKCIHPARSMYPPLSPLQIPPLTDPSFSEILLPFESKVSALNQVLTGMEPTCFMDISLHLSLGGAMQCIFIAV